MQPVTLAGIVAATALGAGSGAGGPQAFEATLHWSALAVAAAILLNGLQAWFRHRDPPRPRKPRRQIAKLPYVPREPASTIHEIAYHCVICGRPLSNPESMRARVGSTCIQRYGPRYKMVPNPEHAVWRGLLTMAEVSRAAEQAGFDHAFQKALSEHAGALEAHAAELLTDDARNRALARRRAQITSTVGALAWVTSLTAEALIGVIA